MDVKAGLRVVTVRKGTSVSIVGVFDESEDGERNYQECMSELRIAKDISDEVKWKAHPPVMRNVVYKP